MKKTMQMLALALVLLLCLPATGLAMNAEGYPICDEVITIAVAGPER